MPVAATVDAVTAMPMSASTVPSGSTMPVWVASAVAARNPETWWEVGLTLSSLPMVPRLRSPATVCAVSTGRSLAATTVMVAEPVHVSAPAKEAPVLSVTAAAPPPSTKV